MCGVIALFHPTVDPRPPVDAALARMQRRGPDDEGVWQEPGVALGHRRLAILDLDARAAQPMHSADGRYVIVFNGEIYNFRDLRRGLEADGVAFHTTSDTEVILALFAREGEAMLGKLHGMFAFVVWDRVAKRAFAARDPYGIKPLYVARIEGGVAVASQVKALLATGLVSREPDLRGQAGFWMLGSVPEPHTWYRDIRALPAGHCLWIDGNKASEPRCWCDIGAAWRDAGESLNDPRARHSRVSGNPVPSMHRVDSERHWIPDIASRFRDDEPKPRFRNDEQKSRFRDDDQNRGFDRGRHQGFGVDAAAVDVRACVRDALRESIRRHLVSDVPVGVFLSGGIDSGAVAGLMVEAGARELVGVTIAYDEFKGRAEDEAPVAAQLAAHYGIRHHVRRVTREEFLADLPRILDAMDQPSIDGVNTWYASKAVAELGLKVVVSGVGGDELFQGYSSFDDLPKLLARRQACSRVPGALAVAGLAARVQANRTHNARWRHAPEWLASMAGAWWLRRSVHAPEDLPALMGEDAASEALRDFDAAQWVRDMAGPLPNDPRLALGQIESMTYLRNQLLRDSDWASMDHSVELRTPLVDAHLLEQLQPVLAQFAHFPGKSLLADAPEKSLPPAITQRRKTGFGIPVDRWLNGAAGVRGSSGGWAGEVAHACDGAAT